MKMTRRDVLQAGAFGASVVGMGAFRVSEAARAAGSDRYAEAYPPSTASSSSTCAT